MAKSLRSNTFQSPPAQLAASGRMSSLGKRKTILLLIIPCYSSSFAYLMSSWRAHGEAVPGHTAAHQDVHSSLLQALEASKASAA